MFENIPFFSMFEKGMFLNSEFFFCSFPTQCLKTYFFIMTIFTDIYYIDEKSMIFIDEKSIIFIDVNH